MATIVAQNNIKISSDRPLDGVDLIPYLTGENNGDPHDYLFWRKWEQNAMAVRHLNHKLVANKNQDQSKPELYNLSTDTAETTNISSEEEKMNKQLQKEWDKWNKQLKDRVFPTLGGDKWWTEKK